MTSIESNVSAPSCPFCSSYKKFCKSSQHDFFDCPCDHNVLINFYQSDTFRFFQSIALEKAAQEYRNYPEGLERARAEIMMKPRLVMLSDIVHRGYCDDVTYRDFFCLVWDAHNYYRRRYGAPTVLIVDTTRWSFGPGFGYNNDEYSTVGLIEVFKGEIIRKNFEWWTKKDSIAYKVEFDSNIAVDGTTLTLNHILGQ